MGIRGARRAVAVLYLLAALIPESIATANNPPLNYAVNPALLLFVVAFYGGAAVAIREARVRLGLSWSGILLLGVAFGFANEGVVAATWYEVTPTGYTLLGGVDLAWATLLTIFHAVFSVAIPILVVEAIFPAIAGQRWVGRGGLVVAAGLPALLSLVTLLAPQHRGPRALVLLLTGVLVVVALRRRRAPTDPTGADRFAECPSRRRVRWSGALATTLFFGVGFLVPGVCASLAPERLDGLQLLYVALLLAVTAVGLVVARGWTRRPGWSDQHTLAGVTGLLLPAILITNIQPAAFVGGGAALAVPFMVLLVWLARRRPRIPADPVSV